MIITALLWSSQAFAGEGTTPSKSATVSKEIALGGIHAYLYYEPLGKMDERDLVSGRLALRNTITGEGDAEAPSRTTVVVVDVVGPSFSSGTKGTLSMIARDETRLLRSETVKLEQFFSEGPRLCILSSSLEPDAAR
jgi:hypothetical protein